MRQIEKVKTVLFLFTLAVHQRSDTQADMQGGKSPWVDKGGDDGQHFDFQGKVQQEKIIPG